jgi:hypothetical protein
MVLHSAGLLLCLLAVTYTYGQTPEKNTTNTLKASLQDSMDVYLNSKAVQDFYEKGGHYIKVHENRLLTADPAILHAGNDKKYAAVLSTITSMRLTPQGSRQIKPNEYRVTIDEYRYKQRELSDYVLNTDAPMQLFDRRIAPQILIDYTFIKAGKSLSDDDADFKMYDPIAVKPYSKLTPDEKAIRDMQYPYVAPRPSKPLAPKKIISPRTLKKLPGMRLAPTLFSVARCQIVYTSSHLIQEKRRKILLKNCLKVNSLIRRLASSHTS